MFEFQKEVVINSNKQFKPAANGYYIDGMLYKKEYMGKVFKTVGDEGTKAKIVLTPDDTWCTEGHCQILIELGLDKDYRGDFASALYYFRRPILVDLDNVNVANIENAIKKSLPTDYKLVNVTSDSNTVTIEATDTYITVKKVEIRDVKCTTGCANVPGEDMEVVAGYKTVVDGTGVSVTENVPEFGTYNYLIQNLRLPTYENTRFASPASVEMPAYGAKYTQYSFIYTVPRHIGGTSVVGQVNYSTTTHTFFVNNNVEDFPLDEDGVTVVSNTARLTAPEVVVVTDEVKAPVEEYPVHTEETATTND